MKRSRNFTRRDRETNLIEASTTWGVEEDEAGNVSSFVLEERTGAPTVYPVEDAAGQALTGHTAAYTAWKQAHMLGSSEARQFAYWINPEVRQRDNEEQRKAALERIRQRAISREYKNRDRSKRRGRPRKAACPVA